VRLVVGISGSSGVIYGIRLLEVLRELPDVETHLIMSPAARQTIALETDWKPRDVEQLADVNYKFGDIAAAVSSGSYKTDGMVAMPCSMKTLAGIAHSLSDNLLVRAADVTLKERRRLVIVPRETPLHLGHLRLMVTATEIGAIICPPMPAFYQRPETIEQLIDHTVMRVLDLFDITLPEELSHRWQGARERPTAQRATDPALVDAVDSRPAPRRP
jgi:flavin prenyltransferase